MFSICPSFSVSRGRGVSRVAPLNELLLPPAVTVSIISILITVHGKNSPNLRNKGFARPSVPAGPRPPAPPPRCCFSVVQCKGLTIINATQLHSSALWRDSQGGKTKKPRCAILHILYHCLAADTTLICFAKQPSAKCETI